MSPSSSLVRTPAFHVDNTGSNPVGDILNMGFFDSSIYFDSQDLDRLNERYKRIIEKNLNYVKNKKILDLGYFNGRWSYAALTNGASEVVGIEGRRETTENKRIDNCEVIIGDVIDVLSGMRKKFDTIFCLGLLYHIVDHFILFRYMNRLNPEVIILDTLLLNTNLPYVKISTESTNSIFHAIPCNDKGFTFIGVPSKGIVEQYVSFFGYEINYIEWKLEETRTEKYESVSDYFVEKNAMQRYTMVLKRKENIQCEDTLWF